MGLAGSFKGIEPVHLTVCDDCELKRWQSAVTRHGSIATLALIASLVMWVMGGRDDYLIPLVLAPFAIIIYWATYDAYRYYVRRKYKREVEVLRQVGEGRKPLYLTPRQAGK